MTTTATATTTTYDDSAPAGTFFQLATEIARRSDLTPADKLVLSVIASYWRRYGDRCTAGEATIAEALGLSLRTITRSLRHLADLHVLTITRRGLTKTNLVTPSSTASTDLSTPRALTRQIGASRHAKLAPLDRPKRPPIEHGHEQNQHEKTSNRSALQLSLDGKLDSIRSPRSSSPPHVPLSDTIAKHAASVAQDLGDNPRALTGLVQKLWHRLGHDDAALDPLITRAHQLALEKATKNRGAYFTRVLGASVDELLSPTPRPASRVQSDRARVRATGRGYYGGRVWISTYQEHLQEEAAQ